MPRKRYNQNQYFVEVEKYIFISNQVRRAEGEAIVQYGRYLSMRLEINQVYCTVGKKKKNENYYIGPCIFFHIIWIGSTDIYTPYQILSNLTDTVKVYQICKTSFFMLSGLYSSFLYDWHGTVKSIYSYSCLTEL